MKLLVYTRANTLDAVLIFINEEREIEDADSVVHDELGLHDYNRVSMMNVEGDVGDLYTLHPYEG